MRSRVARWPGARPLLCAFAMSLSAGSPSEAQEKDELELAPPRPPGEAKRPVGAADLAKARESARRGEEPAWRSGVIDSGLAPFPAAMYQFENQWHEIVNGAHLKVYAGSLGTDPSQGVIVAQRISLDNRADPPQEVRAPAGVGSLRITAATGTLLTLRSSGGAELAFDAASGSLTAR